MSITPNIHELSKAKDIKAETLKALGDLSKYEVYGSNVLVATHVRSEVISEIKTHDGRVVHLFGTDKKVDEDRWQGTMGFILKLGPTAFKYDGPYEWSGKAPSALDWVMFHSSDARELFIRKTSCKLIDSSLIRMKVPDPSEIY